MVSFIVNWGHRVSSGVILALGLFGSPGHKDFTSQFGTDRLDQGESYQLDGPDDLHFKSNSLRSLPFPCGPVRLQVAIHALQMLNELVALDFKALGATALLSGVPAVARYAGRGVGLARSQDTRLQAAYFLQFLAHTNLLTAQLLVTCQVDPPSTLAIFSFPLGPSRKS